MNGRVTHRLLLIRHAQTEPGVPDALRELTDRGRRDAAAIGEWLRAQDVVPDRVAVSPATRARQTLQLTGIGTDTVVDDRIYDSDLANLLTIVRETPESVATFGVVGHNPPIEVFAARHGGPGAVSTGSVVLFDVDGTWADGEIRYVDVATCRG